MTRKIYVLGFLTAAVISAVLFKLSFTSSAGCNAFTGGKGKFMAYCDIGTHGHYDHAAYLFDLEEGLTSHVRHANLLFLGDSRTQFAFSTQSLTNFAVKHPEVHPYLLGFGYGEQDIFSAAVIDRIKPTPSIVVINADPFFSQLASPHANQLLNNKGLAENDARVKKGWHHISEAACNNRLPVIGNLICGSYNTVYRSAEDGRWVWHNEQHGITHVSEAPHSPDDEAAIQIYAANAEKFLRRFSIDRQCIILTHVPTGKGKSFTAQGIATRLGTPFIAPHLSSLSTFDGSHLDTTSSERWSKAFLSELEPMLTQCLN